MTNIETNDFDYLVRVKEVLKEPIIFKDLKNIDLIKQTTAQDKNKMTPMAYLAFKSEINGLSWEDFSKIVNQSNVNHIDGFNLPAWHYIFTLNHKYENHMKAQDYFNIYKKIDKSKYEDFDKNSMPLIHIFSICVGKKNKSKLNFFKIVLSDFKNEINRKNNEENTPLLMALSSASKFQNTEVIEQLLKYGADPYIQNNEGYDIFTAEETDLALYNKIIENELLKKNINSNQKKKKNL